MNFSWRTILITATILCFHAAFAASLNDYQLARSQQYVTPLTTGTKVAQTMANEQGKVFEFGGTVIGTFSNDRITGILFKIDDQQTIILNYAKKDTDVSVGKKLNMLAYLPQNTGTPICLSVTPQQSANKDDAMLQVMNWTAAVSNGIATSANIPKSAVTPPATVTPPTPPIVGNATTITNIVQPTTVDNEPEPERINYEEGDTGDINLTQVYGERICKLNGRISQDMANSIAGHIIDKSRSYNVDPRLVFALILQESRFNPRAVSRSGARGLGQLMPGTAAGLGVKDSFNIEQNIDGSVRYLRKQIDSFGCTPLALAAYNAGPGAVRKYNGIPPYKETQNYSRKVWHNFCSLAGYDPSTTFEIASN